MNKKGLGTLGIIAIIIVLAVVVGGGYMLAVRQTVSTTSILTEKGVTGDCEDPATLTWRITDAINPGTAVSGGAVLPARIKAPGSSDYSYDISLAQTDELEFGTMVDLIINGSGYIASKTESPISVKCGPNEQNFRLNKLDGSPTVKIYNDGGTTQLTDAATGGTSSGTNVSSSASPVNLKMTLTTPSDEAIDTAIVVIECANTTEINDISLTSTDVDVEKGNYKPELHTAESSLADGEIIKAFKLSNVPDDGITSTFFIGLEPETGKTMGTGDNACYVTWYIEQAFVDTDGTFKIGVEDVDGTAKHVTAASSDYDFSVGNA